jgi:glycosyltransferase involved in cell wall biosynthesis
MSDAPLISVVIPVYNEAGNILELTRRLLAALSEPAAADGLGTASYEILFVDDGSNDQTAALVLELAGRHPCIRLIRLSRNFGHQAALLAGLTEAAGQAVISLDGDLQHPPELIPDLLRQWRTGAEIVQAVRRETAGASWLKRTSSRGFYGLLSAISRSRITPGAADFRLLSREALEAFLACRERCRFNRGLVQWIGFETVEVQYDAAARFSGRSKYSYRAMLRLAGDAIFSFSTWPLRLAGLAGVVVSLAAGAYLLFVLAAPWLGFAVQPGWSSILATILALGGMNLIVLWILGEYVGRLFEEVKQRPLYITRRPRTQGTATNFMTRGSNSVMLDV